MANPESNMANGSYFLGKTPYSFSELAEFKVIYMTGEQVERLKADPNWICLDETVESESPIAKNTGKHFPMKTKES